MGITQDEKGNAMKRARRYTAEYQGRKVRVTIPERRDQRAYEGDLSDILQDVLRDTFGPEAIAALANAVRVQVNGNFKDRAVRRQLHWLADRLVEMLGGEEAYVRLCKEAGVPSVGDGR